MICFYKIQRINHEEEEEENKILFTLPKLPVPSVSLRI
jgi:hypothetical protein